MNLPSSSFLDGLTSKLTREIRFIGFPGYLKDQKVGRSHEMPLPLSQGRCKELELPIFALPSNPGPEWCKDNGDLHFTRPPSSFLPFPLTSPNIFPPPTCSSGQPSSKSPGRLQPVPPQDFTSLLSRYPSGVSSQLREMINVTGLRDGLRRGRTGTRRRRDRARQIGYSTALRPSTLFLTGASPSDVSL